MRSAQTRQQLADHNALRLAPLPGHQMAGNPRQEVEGTGVTTETTKTMHGVARAYGQTVKVKKEKNNGQASQNILESSDADMDCQFRLDMEGDMQESEQLAVLAEHEYANRINMLNKQLKRLRPGGQSLCEEDVGVQYGASNYPVC